MLGTEPRCPGAAPGESSGEVHAQSGGGGGGAAASRDPGCGFLWIDC